MLLPPLICKQQQKKEPVAKATVKMIDDQEGVGLSARDPNSTLNIFVHK